MDALICAIISLARSNGSRRVADSQTLHGGSFARTRRWWTRGILLATGLALMLSWSRIAHAQSVGASETDFESVFKKFGYSREPETTANDGGRLQRFKHSSGTRWVAVHGAAETPYRAVIGVPWIGPDATPDIAFFLVLVCQRSRCDKDVVGNWITENLHKGTNLALRNGELDFDLSVGGDTLPIILVSADARPKFREDEAARATKALREKEEAERAEAARQKRVAADAEYARLDTMIRDLPSITTAEQVSTARQQIDTSVAIDPARRTLLTYSLLSDIQSSAALFAASQK